MAYAEYLIMGPARQTVWRVYSVGRAATEVISPVAAFLQAATGGTSPGGGFLFFMYPEVNGHFFALLANPSEKEEHIMAEQTAIPDSAETPVSEKGREGWSVANDIPDSPYVIDNIKGFENQLPLLLAVAARRIYRGGEIVYLQGEMSKAFYFLHRGKVKVSILKEDGSEKILAIQEGNTFFGESAAFDRHPYFATGVVLERSEISVVPIEHAEAVIREHPEVAFLVIRTILRELRLLGSHVQDLAFLDAQSRLAHILVKLAKEVGRPESGGIVIQKGISHEDLASLTSLSRVRVTTILNYLERENIITKKRCVLVVTDLAKLRGLLSAPSGAS